MPITLLKSGKEYLLLNFEPNNDFKGKVICQVPFSNDIIYESLVRLISSKDKPISKNENVAVFKNLDEHNVTLKIMDYLSSSITPKPPCQSSSEDNAEYIDSYYATDEFSTPLYNSNIKTGIIKDISSTEDGDFYILVSYNIDKEDWFGVYKTDGEIYDTLKGITEIEDIKIQKIDGEYKVVEEFSKCEI